MALQKSSARNEDFNECHLNFECWLHFFKNNIVQVLCGQNIQKSNIYHIFCIYLI